MGTVELTQIVQRCHQGAELMRQWWHGSANTYCL